MAYRWVEHTAEMELAIDAGSEEAVFVEALRAMADLLGGARGGERTARDVSVTARDRGALLVAWLDELVYLAETEDLVPETVEGLALADDRLTASVVARVGRPPHLVKAATYNHLTFERSGDGYRATVVLDV